MDNKKIKTIGIVAIIVGIALMILAYFYSEFTLGGWGLGSTGGVLFIIGVVFVIAKRIGYMPT
ncbi:MAG: hypothetical protein ACXACR_17250 [Candidatus Hodarchaeales archaeon]